jgi:hypothetical protein
MVQTPIDAEHEDEIRHDRTERQQVQQGRLKQDQNQPDSEIQ